MAKTTSNNFRDDTMEQKQGKQELVDGTNSNFNRKS